jgi:hypothetical protein
MIDFLPKELREGLARARQLKAVKKSRLRVMVDDRAFPVLRMTGTGFSLPAEAPRLRGLVDLYDGSRHVAQCLIVASEEDADEICYEYKRRTRPADRPALDFERDEAAPVARLPR